MVTLEIRNLYPGGFASNCYLVTEGEDAVLIDCSAAVPDIRAALGETHTTLRAVICTHGHFDHVLTADAVRDAFGVPLWLHREDAEMLTDGEKNAFATFFGFPKTWRPAERLFDEGDTLTFGKLCFKVHHTPGHSKGSSSLLCEDTLFTGDTLFANGYGRTDLYGGDDKALCSSLQRLYTLPGRLAVYPGHGQDTILNSLIK